MGLRELKNTVLSVWETLDRKLRRLVLAGVGIGLLLFVAELGFAYSLQAFLFVLGLVPRDRIALPAGFPIESTFEVVATVFTVGALRSVFLWWQFVIQGRTHDLFKDGVRSRMIHWVYSSPSVSQARAMVLVGERTTAAGTAVMSVQAGLIQSTSCVLIALSLMKLSPKMTFLTLPALIVLGLPLKFLDDRVRTAGVGISREWERLNLLLTRSIKNLLLLQILGTLKQEEKKALETLRRHSDHLYSFYRSTAHKFTFPQIAGLLIIAGLAFVSTRDPGTAYTPGIFVTFFYLFVRFTQNLSELSKTVSNLTLLGPQISDIRNWLSEKRTESNAYRTLRSGPAPASRLDPPTWRLSNVSFRYPDAKDWILRDFDATIEARKTTVIFGPSGSGKSTLLALLLGTSAPEGGRISIVTGGNGPEREIGEIRNDLLRSVGYVGPEGFLIEGTLLENLKYGLPFEPSEERVRRALAEARCDFATDLGLSHFLTEQGQGLSAGQKQRLCLARAFLRDPSIIVLDEATSNLDQTTEERIIDVLSAYRGKATIVIVSHRRSFARTADRVIEFGDGPPRSYEPEAALVRTP